MKNETQKLTARKAIATFADASVVFVLALAVSLFLRHIYIHAIKGLDGIDFAYFIGSICLVCVGIFLGGIVCSERYEERCHQ